MFQLTDGAREPNSGMCELGNGVFKLTDGARETADGMREVINGVGEDVAETTNSLAK